MMVSVAKFGPVALGLKVRVCEQVALAAIVAQVPVFMKAVAFVPDSAMLLTVMDAEPMFFIVNV